MNGRACLAGLIFLFSSIAAAAPLTDQQTIPLWNGKAPGALGDKPEDTPQVQVFLPHEASQTSIVVCPGGGYGGLANHEGPKVGEWLASHGWNFAPLTGINIAAGLYFLTLFADFAVLYTQIVLMNLQLFQIAAVLLLIACFSGVPRYLRSGKGESPLEISVSPPSP